MLTWKSAIAVAARDGVAIPMTRLAAVRSAKDVAVSRK